jgi:hypothetical protein
MPRIRKSKPPKPISEKTRESDEALRRELEKADPEKFKRLIKPLFRSSEMNSAERTWHVKPEKPTTTPEKKSG